MPTGNKDAGAQPDPGRIKGVFSTTRTQKIGTGTTARRVDQAVNYYAEEMDDGVVELQMLSDEWVPVGPRTRVTRDELLADYLPEPGIYQKEVLPRLREVQKAVARGEKFRRRGETFTAEFEFSKALAVDESNVRANFGIGLCYMERGDDNKAREVFNRVVGIDAAFQAEHKHLFNEFGINLRKKGMNKEAAEYYRRALDMTKHDENLHYNLARALYEDGKIDPAMDSLKKCLEMAPDHEEAKTFLAFLNKKRG